jgi:hypothetical protein
MCIWVLENLLRLAHSCYVCEKIVWMIHFLLWLFLRVLT